jgi:hypothetical protein
MQTVCIKVYPVWSKIHAERKAQTEKCMIVTGKQQRLEQCSMYPSPLQDNAQRKDPNNPHGS